MDSREREVNAGLHLGGSRIGLYVPAERLGGHGDVASAVKLSRLLQAHGARVTVYMDAQDRAALAIRLDRGGPPDCEDLYLAGGRGPVACESFTADGIRWVATARYGRSASFGSANVDLLVCVHDLPARP